MTDNTSNNKRIAKNTALLYIRMIVMMAISFYTTRVILSSLGATNYGIYNVVGSLASMFQIISSSLSSSISRFFTYALGKEDKEEQKKVFSTAINIHLLLAFVIIFLIETLGVWFLNNKMDIPADRIEAANWVLQLSGLAFAINIIALPYNAAIIANEKMSIFAYMTILDSVARLLIAITINLYEGDRLILYATLCLFPPITSLFIYQRYCKKKFEACTYGFVLDKKLFKEIFSFAGWSFIGSIAAMMKGQGVNIVLNMFYGPIVNAARGVAMQINGIITQFISNFTMALNPQIIKDYAIGNLTRMHKLMFIGTRLSYYLFMILSIPAFLEVDTVLEIWLGDVPAHTIAFTRLVLILSLAEILSQTLITAQVATGKIKTYQIVVGGILLLNLPLSYIALYLGFSPESTIIVAIIIAHLCFIARLFFLRRMVSLPVGMFIKNVYFNVTFVTIISFVLPCICHYNIENEYTRLLTVCIVSVLSSIAVIYFIGCNYSERELVKRFANNIKNRILRK